MGHPGSRGLPAMNLHDPFVCLDCGEGKALEDMATECTALKHAVTGQRTGSCKECHA